MVLKPSPPEMYMLFSDRFAVSSTFVLDLDNDYLALRALRCTRPAKIKQ